MLIEICDLCSEPITKLDRTNGQPELEPNEPLFSISIEPQVVMVSPTGGTSISRKYMLCSPDCLVQFSNYMDMCFRNPKYKGVPMQDLLEAFFKGELKPLIPIESGETEVQGERAEQPDTTAADPNVTRILNFTRHTEPTPTT